MSETEQKYDVLEKIGHGSFGVIRKVRRREDGMVLCRKEISYLKMSQKEREQLHAEFQILSTLRHANIVGYYHREHLKVTQDLHLYMEYCGNGDLGRVIRELSQKNQYAEESFVWSIFAQLVTALYRCHYGVDPPEVGKNVLGLGNAAKPKVPAGGVTILHRDLKPENVFLGEDNSVKLGDFGLAKMIQSHDFASTYVGTPFYMSPEICAAEKYTLKSDIWSLGCIIYELCAREPPFNAKSHYQLVQKIKEGKLVPLPVVYSPELCTVVRDCLKVNPDRRPDTATLLNLPVVRLMRKEKEVVEMGRVLKAKEEQLGRRVRETERKMEADKQQLRQELDASMRREWEVKARLEIDRLVNAELDHLQKKFEQEVRARVDAELLEAQKKMAAEAEAAAATAAAAAAFAAPLQHQHIPAANGSHPRLPPPSSSVDLEFSSSVSKSEYNMHSSIDDFSGGDGDFPSTTDITDITELSIDESMVQQQQQQQQPSPPPVTAAALTACSADSANAVVPAAATAAFMKRQNAPVPQARTPFARAQTMFAGTPMDVEMASPSPMAIASLSLSPRRNAATKAPTANSGSIFAADDPRWHGPREPLGVASSDWDSDDEAGMPSPTRLIQTRKNLFTSKKMQPQQQMQPSAAPVSRPGSIPLQKTGGLLFSRPRSKGLEAGTRTTATAATASGATTMAAAAANAAVPISGGPRERGGSPGRRLSKIPSAANSGSAAAAPSSSSSSSSNSSSSSSSSTASDGVSAASDGVRVLARKASFSHRKDGEATIQPVSTVSSHQQQQPVLGHGLVSKQKPGIRGRTLVELQQARAGGRPMSSVVADGSGSGSGSGFNGSGLSGGNMSPKRPFREHAAAANRGGLAMESPAVWDPEQDEMPSPFLVRRKIISVGPIAMGGGSSSSSSNSNNSNNRA